MDFKLKKSNLNFRVYTAASIPTTGTENDIVVVSETPMTNWIMSPDKPSGIPRSDGDVWIQYSVAGNTFNALKNSSLMIATISAWQYMNNAWADVTAKSYQGGEWVDWAVFIVSNGVITKFDLDGRARTGATITFTESTGKLNVKETSGKSTGITIAEKMSVDDISKICAKINVNVAGTTTTSDKLIGVSIALFSALNNSTEATLASAIVRQEQAKTVGEHDLELPVSDVSGSYYIGFVFASGSAAGNQANFDIIDFYMV